MSEADFLNLLSMSTNTNPPAWSMQGDSRLGARVSTHRLFTLCRRVSQTHLLILHRLDDFSVPIVLDHSVREQRMLRE